MFDRSYRFGRFMALCAVLFIAASLSAQNSTLPNAPKGSYPSRADLFMGYSYFGSEGHLTLPNGSTKNFSSIDYGAIGSLAYYFNRYLGAQVEFAAHPDGGNDGLYTVMAGAIARLPENHYTLFAHVLGGGAKLGGPNGPENGGYNGYTVDGPALVAGGGLDYDIPYWNHRFGLRLVQADYEFIHVTFSTGEGAEGGTANLPAVRLSTGVLIRLGQIAPPPPVALTCVAAPASAYPGDPVTVTGTASYLNPKMTATYVWTSDTVKLTSVSTSPTVSVNTSTQAPGTYTVKVGGNTTTTTTTASVDTSTLAPGTYTVKGHVSEGDKPGQMADCAASFTVMAIQPPTLSCAANPSSVNPGDSSTITATGVSPQNRPLTYSYSASAGSISGSTSTASLSTAGAAPGTIVVTCNVVDDKANAVSATTQVTVVAPPPPPMPATSSLCSISFERDKARPTRVDNEAKACLDDIALNLQRSSDAKVALVGSSDPKEHHGGKLAAERAVNTKSYLVKEKGIDASRVMVYTGGTDGKTVWTTLVPAGATFSGAGDTPVDETAVKAVPRR